MKDIKAYLELLGSGQGRQKAEIALLALAAGLLATYALYLINWSLRQGVSQSQMLVSFLVIGGLSILAKRQATLKMRRFLDFRIAELRSQITEGICHASYPFIEKLELSEAVTKLTLDPRRISRTGDLVIKGFYGAFIFVFTLLYLGWVSWLALLLFLLLFGISLLSIQIHNPLIDKFLNQAAEEEEKLFAGLEEMVKGFKELKLDAQKSQFFYDQLLLPQMERLRQARRSAQYRIAESLVVLDALWILFICCFFVLSDSSQINAQVLVIFFFLDIPVVDMYIAMPYLADASIAKERMEDLQARLESSQPQAQPPASSLGGFTSLVVQDLSYAYPDQEGSRGYALGPLNLTLYRDEITTITGGNGSGKTTFIKLLLGLYQPQTGRLRLLSQDRETSLGADLFAAVFADFYFFNGLYGVQNWETSRLQDLLTRMGLAHKTSWEEDHFSRVDLSTGQKKRLALITALLEDKPIYVFDEWAAEQDPEFRIEFYCQILPRLKAEGKMVILVSHDDRYFDQADRLIRFDDGKITLDQRLRPRQLKEPQG